MAQKTIVKSQELVGLLGIYTVSTDLIRVNPVSLRTVQRSSEKYEGIKASMRQEGFVGAIEGRLAVDEETGETYVEVINGLQRFTAATEVGIEAIPVDIRDADDAKALELQLMMNFHRVDTKPSEYSEHMRRMLDLNPRMTEAELAKKLGVGTKFVKDRLDLLSIKDERITALIDNGDINLSNAYALARLPVDEQGDWLEQAVALDVGEFVPKVTERVKAIKEEQRAGRKAAGPAAWAPTPHMRRINELKEAIESDRTIKALVKTLPEDASLNEAVALGIKFTMHLDPASVAEQKAKHDAIKEQAEARKESNAAAKVARRLAALQLKEQAEQEKAAEVFEKAAAEGVDIEAVKAQAAEQAKAAQEKAAKAKADKEAAKAAEATVA